MELKTRLRDVAEEAVTAHPGRGSVAGERHAVERRRYVDVAAPSAEAGRCARHVRVRWLVSGVGFCVGRCDVADVDAFCLFSRIAGTEELSVCKTAHALVHSALLDNTSPKGTKETECVKVGLGLASKMALQAVPRMLDGTPAPNDDTGPYKAALALKGHPARKSSDFSVI